MEALLVEAKEASPSIPSDLLDIYPDLKAVRVDGRTSCDPKNAGAEAASGD